jgi:molybdopterin-guanine dinucleotide biosynthesis protein A
MMSKPPVPLAITAAVLAGGRGARMGGLDKGWQRLDGRALVDWVVSALHAQGLSTLLIVANRSVEHYAALAPTIVDTQPGFRGPLAGVASALAACTTDLLITVAVDCPQPPPDLVERLYAALTGDTCDCAVAHDGVRRQPLFAVYRRALAESAASALARGLGVSAWQDTLALREVDFSAARGHFDNLNTPADLRAFMERRSD